MVGELIRQLRVEISRSSDRQRRMGPGHQGGILPRREHIVSNEIRGVGQYLLGGHPRGEQAHDHLDGRAQAAHGWCTVADLRFDAIRSDELTNAIVTSDRPLAPSEPSDNANSKRLVPHTFGSADDSGTIGDVLIICPDGTRRHPWT